MAYTLLVKRGTTASYAALNRVYSNGEILAELGVDGLYRLKIGDGVTAYNTLPYVVGGEGSGSAPGFGTLAVPGQSNVVAETPGDTATLIGTSGIALTTNAGTDTLTFAPEYGNTANTICQGNDARLSGGGVPSAHATTHRSGGTDAIKLDQLAAPDDVTTLNASTAAHGLLRKLSNVATQYLDGTGAWSTPASAGFGGIISVKTYGAVGNGVADDTAAVQAAVEAAQTSGGAVFFPEGDYRLTSTLLISGRIDFYGIGAEPYKHNLDGTRGRGSWLYLDHTGVGIYCVWSIDEANDISGLVLRDFATLRNQPTPAPGWAPFGHDYDIVIERTDVAIYRVMLWNATHGINLIQPGNGLGRITIDGVRGQCFNVGIRVTTTYDVGRISNVHWWPFWNVNDNIKSYQLYNFTGLLLNRADGLMVDNYFAIWYAVGIGVMPSAFGDLNRGQFANITLDLGNIGILVEIGTGGSGSLSVSAQFANLIAYSDPTINSVTMLIRGNNAVIDFVNTELRENPYEAIMIQGTGNIVTFTNTRIGNWNRSNTGAPAISVLAGNVLNFGTKPIFFGGGGAPRISSAGTTINYQDDAFFMDVSQGNPILSCDGNDYMAYDRLNNRFEFYIGGVRRAYVDTAGFHNG